MNSEPASPEPTGMEEPTRQSPLIPDPENDAPSDSPVIGSTSATLGDHTLCFTPNSENLQYPDLPEALSVEDPTPSRNPDTPIAAPSIELIQRIAQGGSGEIWEAYQPELQRTVAVKRLRMDIDDGYSDHRLRRLQELHFRQEALTTGYLEHPNILPVYDVVSSRDGRPMLIMKLVQGSLWNDAISQDYSRLPTMEFLTRHTEILATVANAVAYAHSRSVLHRDLKPSQVMIGGFDEILLMDWGLAMAWEAERPCLCPTPGPRSESPLYRPMNPAGTPTFMAPEQLRESLDGLSPLTDIYLLGGILYLLLCGRAPHWVASKKRKNFTPETRDPIQHPQQAAPAGREVPPALAELAMTALHPDPSKRPPTAQQFRIALLDWISTSSRRRECELIVASIRPSLKTPDKQSVQDSYASLAERVAALDRALALAPHHPEANQLREQLISQYAHVAITHGDLTLARVQAEQLADTQSRTQLLGKISELQAEFDRHDQHYRAALTAATEARAHTERLRAHAELTVRFLIHDLHQPLKEIGRLDLLRTAAEQAMRHFDSSETLDEYPDPTILHNRAIALLNIGDVLNDEGNKAGAITAFVRAVNQLERLSHDFPEEARWRVDLGRAYDRLAQQYYYNGQNEACRELCRKALPILQSLADSAPPTERSERLLDIARTGTRMGFAFWRERALDEAMECFQAALTIAQDQAARHPGQLAIEQAHALILVGIGNVHRDRSEMDEAITINERILRLRTRLHEAHKDNIPLLEDVFWTRNNLGLMYQLAGRLEEAEALLSSDCDQRKAHSEAMPGSIVRQALRSFPLSLLAETRLLLGRIHDAYQTYLISYELDRRVADTDPSPHYQGGVAFAAARLAETALLLLSGPTESPGLAAAEDFPTLAPTALPNLALIRRLSQEAITAAKTAHDRTPTNAFYNKAMARALLLRGRLLATDGQNQQAHQIWTQAIQLLEPIAPIHTDPATDELRAALALCLGEADSVQILLPFLQTRRWYSPLVQQIQQRGPRVDQLHEPLA